MTHKERQVGVYFQVAFCFQQFAPRILAGVLKDIYSSYKDPAKTSFFCFT